MPKAWKKSASEVVALEGSQGHIEKMEGGYTLWPPSGAQPTPTCRSPSSGCTCAASSPTAEVRQTSGVAKEVSFRSRAAGQEHRSAPSLAASRDRAGGGTRHRLDVTIVHPLRRHTEGAEARAKTATGVLARHRVGVATAPPAEAVG